MASAAAWQCPGAKVVFIRGMRFSLTASNGTGFGRVDRGSWGFSASAGMAQDRVNFRAPGIRPAAHSCCTVRLDRFHLAAISCAVRYSMAMPPKVCFFSSNYMRSRA